MQTDLLTKTNLLVKLESKGKITMWGLPTQVLNLLSLARQLQTSCIKEDPQGSSRKLLSPLHFQHLLNMVLIVDH